MDLRLNDVVEMKKPHPCGEKIWLVTRVGMDIKAASGLDDFYASGMKMPARGVAALALLYDLSCFYYPLPLCLSCRSAQ